MSSPSPVPEASQWVDLHSDYLFRFALARVRDPEAAEDLVQETLVSAIRSRERFVGASALRTWLVAILKHKILDYFRARHRTVLASDLAPPDADNTEDRFFDLAGQWQLLPQPWPKAPDQELTRKEFQQTLAGCVAKLPDTMAQLFILRDVEELESEKVCEIMGISPSNLYTMLHRARLRLRRCLEQNWFEPPVSQEKRQ